MSKPTLPAIILGRKLLQLRIDAGLTQAQAAKRSRFSDSKLSDIENGKGRIRLFDVAGLCRIYEATAELTQQLERMSDEVDSPSWWEPYSTYMLRDFSMCLELEGVCSAIDIYESELINGLLQTPEYARAVNRVVPQFDEQETEQAVALQATRQDQFWNRNPMPTVRIVLHESTVTRPIVEEGQHTQLLDIAERPNVDLRVLTHSEGSHPSMKGSYMILSSGIPEIADSVYTETITGAKYDTTPDIVTGCRETFEATLKHTTPMEEYLR